jgi:hypothetical protein
MPVAPFSPFFLHQSETAASRAVAGERQAHAPERCGRFSLMNGSRRPMSSIDATKSKDNRCL